MDKTLRIEAILDRRIEKDEVEYYIRQSGSEENQCSWVKERCIPNQIIDQYNALLVKGRDVELIIGATPTRGGTWFYVKWAGQLNGSWLPSHVMKEEFPQPLIEFYEKNLFF